MAREIVVIGGGVAGLVAARDLALAGDRVRLVEARDSLGGAVTSGVLAGVRVDLGAESYAITRPQTQGLVDELGLADAVIRPRRSDAHLLEDDGLFAMPHGMLGIPTSLASAEVVAIIGDAAAHEALALDRLPPREPPPDVTIGALVRERMGEAVVERITGPVVAGVHAADPDLVEAEAVVPGILRALREEESLAAAAGRLRAASGIPGSAVVGLDRGMTRLVDALGDAARAAGVVIDLDRPVASLRPADDGWVVTTRDGDEATPDAVVLAVDAPAATALLPEFHPLRTALAAIRTEDVAVVALVVDEVALDADPLGSGLLVAHGHPRVRAKALTHASAKWAWIREAYGPARHLVRLSYGRDGELGEDEDALVGIAAADLATILGLPSVAVVDAAVARWDRSLVAPTVGHQDRVAVARTAGRETPGIAVVGAGLGGNGLAGTITVAHTVSAQLDGSRGENGSTPVAH